MSNDVRTTGRRRAFSWLGIIFIGVPLLYVLSAAPVCKLLEKNHWLDSHVNWDYVRAVYAPLIWLQEKTFLKTPIDFYMKLLGIY